MRFVIFVEGRTEKNSIADFIRRALNPRLTQPVGISVVAFGGFPEYLSKIKDRVYLYLTENQRDQIIAAIGLIDLYGPTIFPAALSSTQKAAWGKTELEKHVGNSKFRQYFAVHETEAWLLADETALPEGVREALPSRCSQPEAVDMNEPPSKLLARLYHQRLQQRYHKAIHGPKLFQRCAPDVVAAKCPHFSQMLNDLEQLARDAGHS